MRGQEKRARSTQGEKIYDDVIDITGVTDFGVSLEALNSGQTPIPPQGLASISRSRAARAVACRGASTGPTTSTRAPTAAVPRI